MIELIYDNPKTEIFAEFTLIEGNVLMSESEIIDAFMQKVKTFDDTKGITLPYFFSLFSSFDKTRLLHETITNSNQFLKQNK